MERVKGIVLARFRFAFYCSPIKLWRARCIAATSVSLSHPSLS